MRLELSLAALMAFSACPAVVTGGQLDGSTPTGGGSEVTGGGSGSTGGGTAATGGGSDTGGGSAQSGGGSGATDGGLAISAKGTLRFKGPERLANDYALGLGLNTNELCKELGLYDCASVVHRVSLGGVDAYSHGLYEAPTTTGAATNSVVDRIALSACNARVTKDLATPASALVFKNIALTQGKLSNPQSAEVRTALTELYQRALQRDPTETEISRLIQLATEIEGATTVTPATAWMKAACFAVFSSAEAVFY